MMATDSSGQQGQAKKNFDYDIIVYGNELPAIVEAIAAARAHKEMYGEAPRILLARPEDAHERLGGHVTGGLAYLDRDQENPYDESQSKIYQEILDRSGSKGVALDGGAADFTIRKMLEESGVDLLSGADISSVEKDEAGRIASISTTHGALNARNYVDGTQTAQLARAIDEQARPGEADLFSQGLTHTGAPDDTIPVGVPFETRGMSVEQLKQLEQDLYNRLSKVPLDAEAQKWLEVASGGNPERLAQLQKEFSEPLKPMYMTEEGDAIDVRSSALSVAFHGQSERPMFDDNGQPEKVTFDKANIAVLPDGKLSFNSILVRENAEDVLKIADNGNKPTPEMSGILSDVGAFFANNVKNSAGAPAMSPAIMPPDQVYIRYGGSVLDVKDSLTGAEMQAGGVDAKEAIGSYEYGVDIRGGLGKWFGQITEEYGIGDISLPKVDYNLGVEHTLSGQVANLSIVSPSGGYDGLGWGAGRIVENNAIVAEAHGAALAKATHEDRDSYSITNEEARELRLEQVGEIELADGVKSNHGNANLGRVESALSANADRNPSPVVPVFPTANVTPPAPDTAALPAAEEQALVSQWEQTAPKPEQPTVALAPTAQMAQPTV